MRHDEATIAQRCIKDLLAAGYSLAVNDGEETSPTSTNAKRVFSLLGTVDMEHLVVYNDNKKIGWVFFVYGNEPGVLISDYTVNLEPALAGVNRLADELTG